jgi:NAD(P)-dependent dehydrogenase (short-subunit alcohol dehydrogenase family)
MSRKVAFITGASRGIGKACAIELAAAGFDIAVTARTVKEGEWREHSSTLKSSDPSVLPGSIESTIAEVEKNGAKALGVAADLLDPASLGAAVTRTLDLMGRIATSAQVTWTCSWTRPSRSCASRWRPMSSRP